MKHTLIALILVVILAVSLPMGTLAEDTILYPSPEIRENLPEAQPALSEDFYLHFNYDLMKDTVMPEGKSSYSAFTQIEDEITAELLEILNNETEEGPMKHVFDYYKSYMDMDARNAAGWSHVFPYGEMIMSAETLDVLWEKVCSDLALAYLTLPLAYAVASDAKDSTTEVSYLFVPYLDLGDSAEYSEMTSYGRLYKDADDAFFTKLLRKYGFEEAETSEIIEKRYALESKFAQYIYPTETSYRSDWIEMTYNPYTEEEVLSLAGSFPMDKFLAAYRIDGNDKYIVDQPAFYEALPNILTEENLDEIKAWMLMNLLIHASTYTDEEAYTAYNDWTNTKNGSTGMKPLGELANNAVGEAFPELLGQLYAERFFSPEEKEEVTDIVYDLIDVYRTRIQALDWLSEETKATAIEKLDAMGVYIGYPEVMRCNFSEWEVPEDADLFTFQMAYIAERVAQESAYAGKPANPAAWGTLMAPYAVNACYYSTNNSIYFPAAILKAPFYSKDNSLSANMGGIGMVIGHEITHAFDTSGSQFDKNGNMNNWWTEEDRTAFTEKTEAVAARYSAYVLVDDMHVNGDLTIGETVADLGGTAAALQVLENRKAAGEEIDYTEFFEQNAHIWYRVVTKEDTIWRLKYDPHAPACLRTNVNVAQFDAFHETYGIREGDNMYTAPEDRLRVW